MRAYSEQDCWILKQLADVNSKAPCYGCYPKYALRRLVFNVVVGKGGGMNSLTHTAPSSLSVARYYYHSEKSGICYNEFIESTPLTKFMKAQNLTEPEGVANMKELFHQALDALDVLLAQGMVHRDLQAQNMLVRNVPKPHNDRSNAPFQLVVMDFCWLNSIAELGGPKLPHKFSTDGRKLGRFTRAADWKENGEEDTYAFGCAVADVIFMGGKEFKNKDKYRDFCLPDMERTRTDKKSLEYVIWRMTQQKRADREHDFKKMHAMVDAVTRIAEKR